VEFVAEFLPLAAVVFVASAVQAFFGFGFGIIAMGVITMSWDVVHASAFVNITSLMMCGTMIVREYRRVLWPVVARTLPPMAVGIAIGLVALNELPRDLIVGALAATITGVAAWNVISPSLTTRVSAPLDAFVGFIAGLSSGAFQVGGPPLVVHLYRRPEPPLTLVVTLQAIFVGSGLIRGFLAHSQGLLSREHVVEALYVLPAVLVGTLLGLAASKRTDPLRFRRAAWVALGMLGIALFASAFP
jgi:uncharacterized membrane protein YfcA